MSDTLAPVERARVLVPTKNDVLETRKEAIQTDRVRVETLLRSEIHVWQLQLADRSYNS